jgi:DNA-binding NarL/FixJ family response regulator
MNESVMVPSPPVDDIGTISVAVIEDNRLMREGISALLNQLPDLVVIGGGASLREAWATDRHPHVVLLDLGLRNGDALREVTRVKDSYPGARVIVMDLLPVQEEIVEFVNAGVSGFIMKDASLDDLVSCIRLVAQGADVLPPQLTGSLFSQIARDAIVHGRPSTMDSVRMTPRERQVVALIGEGLGNKEIAARLHIATHTVKSHVRNVMEKLALHTRLQIAAYAHRDDARGHMT